MDNNALKEEIVNLVKNIAEVYHIHGAYSDNHLITRQSLGKLFHMLEGLLSSEKKITLEIVNDELMFRKEPLGGLDENLERFIMHLRDIGASNITFLEGVTEKEVSDFVGVISLTPETLRRSGGVLRKAAAIGLKKINFSSKTPFGEQNNINKEELIKQSRLIFVEGNILFKSIEKDITEKKWVDISSIRGFIAHIVENFLVNKTALLILTSVKGHDGHSYIHNINVAILSILQAESLGIDERSLNEIGVAALLHDIGKFSVPVELLRKNKGLTEEEFMIIKKHTINGAKSILGSPLISELAAIVAFEHHLKCDQSGYPERVFPAVPNLASMIVAISDVYDALRSKRAYAGEIAPEKTYQEMVKLSGKHFDADLLDNFFCLVGVYPPGTLVELDTGEVALVVRSNMVNKKRPQVEILYDRKGMRVKDVEVANLLDADPEGAYKRTILHSIIPTEGMDVPKEYGG